MENRIRRLNLRFFHRKSDDAKWHELELHVLPSDSTYHLIGGVSQEELKRFIDNLTEAYEKAYG
ncbi:UNVERIFIED_CONTAM: hypothetical protein RF648_20580 [Kocuria sp. CPCC 205274]